MLGLVDWDEFVDVVVYDCVVVEFEFGVGSYWNV